MNRMLGWPLMVLALLSAPVGAVQVEDPAGLENLRKSAESGNAEAMLELGILYEFGFRMPDNKAPALAWYRLAAEAGSAKASSRQDALRPTMSAKEVEEANKLYADYAANLRRPAPAPTTPAPVQPAPAPPPPAESAPAPAAK
jgi:TPR repeat protein